MQVTGIAKDRNDKGQLLINVNEMAKNGNPNYTRYNGGWVKRVSQIDKSKTDGYSLIGSFVNNTTWLTPGLYIDCSIAGSRKSHDKRYALLRLTATGEVETLGTTFDKREWAIEFWPAIEEALGNAAEYLPVSESQIEKVWATFKELSEQEQVEIRNRILAE